MLHSADTNEAALRIAGDAAGLAASGLVQTNLNNASNVLHSADTNEAALRAAGDASNLAASGLVQTNLNNASNVLHAADTNEAALRISGDEAGLSASAQVQSNLDLLAATSIVAVCDGGFYNEDYFRLTPRAYAYSASSIGATTAVNSVYAQTNVFSTENGFILDPDLFRSSNFTGAMSYVGLVNFDLVETNGNDVIAWAEGSVEGTTGSFTAVLGDFSRGYEIARGSPTAVWSNVYYISDAPGTLRSMINTSIWAAVSRTGSATYVYSSGWNGTNYVRDTNCWASGIDLTCASPWNNYKQTNSLGEVFNDAGNFCAGNLITPQHFLLATHFPTAGVKPGNVFRWIDATNGVHDGVAADLRNLGSDLTVVRLEEPLPAAIVPAKVLKSTDKGCFRGADGALNSPGYSLVYLDQVERAWFAKSASSFDDPTRAWSDGFYILGNTNWPHSQVHAVGGDSGNGIYAAIGTNTVLCGLFFFDSGGYSIAAKTADIEAALVEMGESVHTNLSYVDLSAWQNYDNPAAPVGE